MSGTQPTLGQAIDQILNALGPLDDGARLTALTAACMQLQITMCDLRPSALSSGTPTPPPPAPPVEATHVAAPVSATPPQQVAPIDIRTFKDQKKPTSARQMACVVAFYLKELAPLPDRKESINTADLEKYFKQGGYKLPAKMPQVLIDAKGAGYFDTPARGEYKLNAVGYNLVAHNLPSSDE